MRLWLLWRAPKGKAGAYLNTMACHVMAETKTAAIRYAKQHDMLTTGARKHDADYAAIRARVIEVKDDPSANVFYI